jgi:hypothetical protein
MLEGIIDRVGQAAEKKRELIKTSISRYFVLAMLAGAQSLVAENASSLDRVLGR